MFFTSQIQSLYSPPLPEREERERIEQERCEEEDRAYQEKLQKLKEQERKQRARQQEVEERQHRRQEERHLPEEKPASKVRLPLLTSEDASPFLSQAFQMNVVGVNRHVGSESHRFCFSAGLG